MRESTITARLVAEFVGTMALVYIGILVLSNGDGGGPVGVALAHGLTIAALASATMMVSGGHLNPAVTIGIWVGGKIRGGDAVGYIMAQLAGGLTGGLLAQLSLTDTAHSALAGVPTLGPGVQLATGILVEAILTFLLVFVVYGTGVDSRFGGRIAGLAIGLTVTLDILAGGPITGAAMNPARWLGAALPAQDPSMIDMLVVYTVGPIVGAVAAGLLYSRVLAAKPEA